MSYSQSTMVLASNAGLTEGFSLYTYKSDDNLATVVTVDYFLRNPRFTFAVDDIIVAQLSDGYAELTVTSESSAVSV